MGGTSFVAGKVDQAFSFDNVDDYVDFPTNGFSASAMTIDLWFNLTSWSGHDDLVQHSTDGGNGNRISLERGNDFDGCAGDRIFLVTGDASGVFSLLCTSTPFALGTWYHIAASFDAAGNTKIYVNGILENSATSARVPAVIAPSFFVGRNFANLTSRLFHGLVDEVEIYNRALSAQEIAAIFNAGSAGKCKFTDEPSPLPLATFHVIKDFSDDNPLPVEVGISCNTGLPLNQHITIRDDGSPDGGVTFVVTTFISGELDCEITETAVAGYAAEYQNTSVPETSDVACTYTAVVGGAEHSCVISNQVLPVSVEVTKQWITLGTGGNQIDKTASVSVFSPTNIEGGDACFNSEVNENGYCKSLAFEGPQTQTQSVLVLPHWQGVAVLIDETVFDDAIETVNECDGSVQILPNEGAACTITNTVFFEGVPTLSQYGLALLALLMLGSGLIGSRRFV